MITFLDFFSGIGTFRIGLEQAGMICKGHVEWDKYAQKVYTTIHDIKGDEFNGWDIREVGADELPRVNLWAFGAPCQDFSIAGGRAGLQGDRSSLIREIYRLIRETKEENRPQRLIYENVKGMLSSNGGLDYLGIISEMDELGYDIQWQTFNSKNWGVPQNRERVYTIGYLRGSGGSKILPLRGENKEPDIQDAGEVTAGIKFIGGIATKWLDDGKEFSRNYHQGNRVYDSNGLASALSSGPIGGNGGYTSLYAVTTGIKQIAQMDRNNRKNLNQYRVYDQSGISPCLNKMDGGGRVPSVIDDRHGVILAKLDKSSINGKYPSNKDASLTGVGCHVASTVTSHYHRGASTNRDNLVMVREATKLGYDIAQVGDSINLSYPNSKPRRGRVGKGVAQTLETSLNRGTFDGYRIRRLTPRECWRLQGIPDSYFDAASEIVSDSQLYKQAGNACTVNVVYEVGKALMASLCPEVAETTQEVE